MPSAIEPHELRANHAEGLMGQQAVVGNGKEGTAIRCGPHVLGYRKRFAEELKSVRVEPLGHERALANE